MICYLTFSINELLKLYMSKFIWKLDMAESVGRDSLYVDGLDKNFCCSVFGINFNQNTPGSKPAAIASLLTQYI